MSSNMTAESLRQLFVDVVCLGNISETQGVESDDLKRQVGDILLRMRDAENRGASFVYENYQAQVVIEAEAYADDYQILGKILDGYADFYSALICFRALPKLRRAFKQKELSNWLHLRDRPLSMRPFIFLYFELASEELRNSPGIPVEDMERFQLLSETFDVSFPPKLQAAIDFFGPEEPLERAAHRQ